MAKTSILAEQNLPRLNRALSLANIVVALYIFITPLLPAIGFYINKRFRNTPSLYSGQLASEAGKTSDKRPKGNRLVIPSILLDEEIHEGATVATLSKGVWRRPATSTPPVASNTVLAGHVFTYSDPAVFYNLNKIKIGEKLAVYWQNSEYLYEVSEIKVVPPSDGTVEAPTNEARLTLYTCTPLWNPKQRLIVISDLKQVTPL